MASGVAKVPSHYDMDWGQFAQHWVKRHAPYSPQWDGIAEKYPDDDAPIWWSLKSVHERNHQGRGRRIDEEPDGPCPTDHVHLPRVDPDIQRQLEELL